MSESGILELYERANRKQIEDFSKSISSTVRVQTDIEKIVKDTEWIELMEETIPYLDNILRNPNRFIINEEEIVKIELARRITIESIRHLSKNTNLIQDIDKKTNDVRPAKILNVNKEESYDTYENKFIYSLIQNMRFFLARKKAIIQLYEAADNRNNKKIDYSGSSVISNEKVNINISLDTKLDEEKSKNGDDIKEILERIENLEEQIRDLTTSEVYKIIDKKHMTLVTSPIKKTNVILKNVNFQYAVNLWNYLQSNLDDKTRTINDKKDYEDEGNFKAMIDDSFFLQYLILNTLGKEADEVEEKEQIQIRKEINNVIVDKMLEKMLEVNSDLTEGELKAQISAQFAIIKYRNLVTMQEIQNIFKTHIDKYLQKISNFKK